MQATQFVRRDDVLGRELVQNDLIGPMSQGVRAFGLRHSRYIGQAKTHLQHVLTAVALTVVRVYVWWRGVPRAGTWVSRFAKLAPQAPCNSRLGVPKQAIEFANRVVHRPG